ncbi:hypothetical protein ACWJKU_12860 [Methylocaldum sp. MU1018]
MHSKMLSGLLIGASISLLGMNPAIAAEKPMRVGAHIKAGFQNGTIKGDVIEIVRDSTGREDVESGRSGSGKHRGTEQGTSGAGKHRGTETGTSGTGPHRGTESGTSGSSQRKTPPGGAPGSETSPEPMPEPEPDTGTGDIE